MHSDDFGPHLKSIRKERCITQAEISDMLNISRQAYSNYEQGRCVPTVTTLIEMSIILNSNLLLFFIPDSIESKSSDITSNNPNNIPIKPGIPEYEILALRSLYESLDIEDRLSAIENMIIMACRKEVK